MKPQIRTIAASSIETDGLQVRAETSREHVESIIESFDEDNPTWPDVLPPVVVFASGERYYLADGHHRLQAAVEAGCAEIRADVRKGGRTDALWYAVGANHAHGLRRNSNDKRRAVLLAKRIAPDMSNREIGKRTNTSHTWVNFVLKETQSEAKQLETSLGLESVSTPSESQIQSAESSEASLSDGGRDEGEEIVSQPPAGHHPAPAAISSPVSDEPDRPVDALGIPARSDGAARAFRVLDYFDQLERLLRQASRLVDEIGSMQGAELYRAECLKILHRAKDGEEVGACYSPDINNSIRALQHWRPYTLCPHCHQKGDIPQHDCGCCKGLPFVTKSAFDRAPAKLREAVEALNGGAR